MSQKKLYFISDTHFGIPDRQSSLERERDFCNWLDLVKEDAEAIYFLGDLFDFWFEYRYVVPKGYVRLLGKLAELSDRGIRLNFFTGNHDMWAFHYLEEEVGVHLYRGVSRFHCQGKSFLVGHGDGLGPGDASYKLMKCFFSSCLLQRIFAFLHPWIGFRIAQFFSKRSRLAHSEEDSLYLGDEKESLVLYCKSELRKEPTHYFIFGHRHLQIDKMLDAESRYVNLGEWVHGRCYAVFEEGMLQVRSFKGGDKE